MSERDFPVPRGGIKPTLHGLHDACLRYRKAQRDAERMLSRIREEVARVIGLGESRTPLEAVQMLCDAFRSVREQEALSAEEIDRAVRYVAQGEPMWRRIPPYKNRKGALCGLCDGTDEHEHERVACAACGREGLEENWPFNCCDVSSKEQAR